MPPKRASIRRSGSVASTRRSVRADTPSGPSNPEVYNPGLPEVRSKQSFTYGSSKTPALPRSLDLKPEMNLAEMAENIDVGLRQAHEHDDFAAIEEQARSNEPRRITRSQHHSASPSRDSTRASVSPSRRRLERYPTPDQQLLDSLREATESPSPSPPPRAPATTSAEIQPGSSTATPTPPVQHTLSTVSTPVVQSPAPSGFTSLPEHLRLTSDRLYPRLPGFGSPARPGSSGADSLLHENSSVDNESLVSWRIERDLQGNELQRTRPYRQEPHGSNIKRPPRRLSGLDFSRDTTQVRSEPESSPSASTAPTKTIIPDTTARESPVNDAPPTTSDQPAEVAAPRVDVTAAAIALRGIKFNWTIVLAILAALAAVLGTYTFGGRLAAASHAIASSLPFNARAPYPTIDPSELETIKRLSTQVERLGAQVSSMSKEMSSVKSEWNKVAAEATAVRPTPALPRETPRETPKVNFLSLGMGAVIDPYITSPSADRSRTLLQRVYNAITGGHHRGPKSPIAALTPWDGVGDCWCSAPRAGISQLAVLLGRQIVPEEVVVEHIPKGASLSPGVAPREMELWARFRPNRNPPAAADSFPSAPSSSSFLPSFLGRFFSSPRPSSAGSSPSPSPTLSATRTFPRPTSSASLHETIMDTLRQAYPREPETAYSDDPLLGPSFYRVGRWQYDINGENHVQRFSLDAVIDIPALRVDKVVFRVKSNWGAENTCLYRLRLYGHL